MTHRCPTELQDLLDLLADSLSPERHRLVVEHLEDCPSCQELRDRLAGLTLKKDRELLRSAEGRPEPARPFPDELAERIGRARRIRRLRGALRTAADRAGRSARELLGLLDSTPEPALAGVRTAGGMIQVDLVNLSEHLVDPELLRPGGSPDRLQLAGFDPDLAGCDAYLLILPLDLLRTRLPGWTPAGSEALVRDWLTSEKVEIHELEALPAARGRLESREGEAVLELPMEESLERLSARVGQLIGALVILPER